MTSRTSRRFRPASGSVNCSVSPRTRYGSGLSVRRSIPVRDPVFLRPQKAG